jgi:hypothetical protein
MSIALRRSNHRYQRPPRRRPSLEQLETRRLMAADFAGVIRNGSQWLFDLDRDPEAETSQTYGLSGDPFYVAGKWTGGVDRPGVVRRGGDGLLHWLLDTDGDPAAEIDIGFGLLGDRPVVGDWDGDGRDNVGVVRNGGDGLWHWFLDLDGDPAAEEVLKFGFPTDAPVVGDWDGDGRDNLGVARRGGDGLWHWFLDLDMDPTGEIVRAFGLTASDRPIPGDWNGDGRDTLGVTRPGSDGLLHWLLDSNGDIYADEDRAYGFPTDIPVKGSWSRPTPDVGNTFSTASGVGSLVRPITINGAIETRTDVDMYRINVVAGQRIWFDIDTPTNGPPGLGSYLRLFNSAGQQRAANNDAQAPNEPQRPPGIPENNAYFDSYIGYTFNTSGTYYIGVSNWQNFRYSPSTGRGTLAPDPRFLTGEYSLTLTLAASRAGAFDIQIVSSGLTAAQREILKAAETRWESVIVGDLPNSSYNGIAVDDVRIDVFSRPIDGLGEGLAQAGPDWVRTGSLLPVHGILEIDSADLAAMQSNGTLYDVILHEIGHVLGIGTLWSLKGLLTGAGGTNPRYIGARGTAEYNAIFGARGNSVPVEDTGDAGTRDAHWRDSVLDNELMTGYAEAPNVRALLSRITVGALADLGYAINMNAADVYFPPTRSTTAGNVVIHATKLSAPGGQELASSSSPRSENRRPSAPAGLGSLATRAVAPPAAKNDSRELAGAGLKAPAWSECVDALMQEV